MEETFAADQVVLPEAGNALHQALGSLRLQLSVTAEENLMRFVAFSPDGKRLATWGTESWDALPGNTRTWDASTGQLLLFFGESYPNACSTITLVYILGMILIWFAPETKGKPLPE